MEKGKNTRNTVILLAAGRGRRMGRGVRKQYRKLCGVPLLAYSLKTFAASPLIHDIVMVIPEGDQDFIEREVLPFAPGAQDKIRAWCIGGEERYGSVYNGLGAISWPCDYVYIHDGARPFIDEDTLERIAQTLPENGTAVAGVPSKDTVKIVDEEDMVSSTPNRSRVWIVQTPQAFSYQLIGEAYMRMFEQLPALEEEGVNITDDAMVVEHMMGTKVRMVTASYRNIKVTTPEDITVAEAFIQEEAAYQRRLHTEKN